MRAHRFQPHTHRHPAHPQPQCRWAHAHARALARAARAAISVATHQHARALPAAAKPWKGATSPKTPGERKRKEPEGPAPFVPAHKAYVNEHKEEYKKKHPDKESKDINKELKAAYEALSVELKQPYEEAAAKDKQRYTEEMKAVRAPCRGFCRFVQRRLRWCERRVAVAERETG